MRRIFKISLVVFLVSLTFFIIYAQYEPPNDEDISPLYPPGSWIPALYHAFNIVAYADFAIMAISGLTTLILWGFIVNYGKTETKNQ